MNPATCTAASPTPERRSADDTLSALEAALLRIARLESTLVELLLKNELLRQQASGIHTPNNTLLSPEPAKPKARTEDVYS